MSPLYRVVPPAFSVSIVSVCGMRCVRVPTAAFSRILGVARISGVFLESHFTLDRFLVVLFLPRPPLRAFIRRRKRTKKKAGGKQKKKANTGILVCFKEADELGDSSRRRQAEVADDL